MWTLKFLVISQFLFYSSVMSTYNNNKVSVNTEFFDIKILIIINTLKNVESYNLEGIRFQKTLLSLLHCLTMSNYLLPYEGQHARPSCPSLSPGVCQNSCPLSWWCHPTVSSSIDPFSFCLRSIPALWSFPMSWLFASAGQSIVASALVLPMNIQDWFSSGLIGLISLLSKKFSRAFSSTTSWQYQFFGTQPLWYNSQIYAWVLEKPYLWLNRPFSKVMSLLFIALSRFVIGVLPNSKRLLISWLQSPSAGNLEPPKNKVCHCLHCFPIYLPWSNGTGCHDLSFLSLSFKPAFSLSCFTFIKKRFSSSSLSAIRVVVSAFLRLLIFLLEILIPACASCCCCCY